MQLRHFGLLAGLGLVTAVLGLGEERVIVFPSASDIEVDAHDNQVVFDVLNKEKKDSFVLASASHKVAKPLLLDSEDNEAIHVAAQTFAEDIYRVTGVRPELYNDTLPRDASSAVIVGSVSSKLVKGLDGSNEHAEGLKGKWESFDVRLSAKPLKGLKEALVVVGSDRRGAIYALYTMSEQMGVSPFHFWADVPVRHKPVVGFSRDRILAHGEPTVKYRGLFINDEHPALWGWAQQRWDVKLGQPAFLPHMYKDWFEMMLRLKSNYFWPAMYASMFDVDGVDFTNGFPQPPMPGPNQVLANRMGIVMGTSHHEPMARNKPEWDRGQEGSWDWRDNSDFLSDWWTYGAERAHGMETLYTLGMRGDGDEPLTGASNKLVENITATQQGILKGVYGDEFSSVPQMWCMYKEVAEYYRDGLEVPEDVSILFADDNWGNIMSVLPPDREHKAGAGVYYHVDYVGQPRSYKWINTINLAKTWEQMSVARAFNTTAIWILNIGSLKPLELPSEHFLSLAYDIDAWPRNSVHRFLEHWAEREFGEEEAEEVADIMAKYSMYASRHKAELVNSTAWSMSNYNEAERVLGEWESLVVRSGKVYDRLPTETRPAFFELVYMLCAMQANLNRLYIAVGRSNLYASQYRTAADLFAQEAIDAFYQDANLTETFHSLLDRKWDHMLDQTHIHYTDHREPMKDTLPPISYINPNLPAREGIPIRVKAYGHNAYIRVTVENSRGAWPGDSIYNCPSGRQCPDPTLLTMDPYGAKTRWVDIGSSGPKDVDFVARPNVDWLSVTHPEGKIMRDASSDERLRISVEWSKAPSSGSGQVRISGSDGSNVTITIPITQPAAPPSSFHGYVEGDGYVVIEAAHFARNASAEGYAFETIDGYGRSLSGLEMFPMTTQNFTLGTGPSLEYDFWSHDAGDVQVTVQIGPTLNYLGADRALSFGVQMDDSRPTEIQPIPLEPLGFYTEHPGSPPLAIGAVPKDWINIVSSEIRNVTLPMHLADAGAHTLKIWGMSTGIIVERIWVDMGGIANRGYSYLGPPESLKV